MKSKSLAIGIVADVDAGKTTLYEEILFKTGIIKAPGRVDRGDAFLDRDEIERLRVATSDRLEQMNVFGSGALRISAMELKALIEGASEEIRSRK